MDATSLNILKWSHLASTLFFFFHGCWKASFKYVDEGKLPGNSRTTKEKEPGSLDVLKEQNCLQIQDHLPTTASL